MRSALFLLTLAFYGFSATDMQEWVRVPQVLVHLLEHHSDLGHHHDAPEEHGHSDEEGHDPFSPEQHGTCGVSSLVCLPCDADVITLTAPTSARSLGRMEMATALSAFSGSKWNPPKQA